ncbi:MAG: hypothetical protein IT484_02805 [Gammaproteobacteria bacterium]|nr:hypothetical protein [Gammaproteobacteria bacterium]
MSDSYQWLRFAHVLLFAYWLGADLGVFLAGGVMSRPGLPVPERNRIRALLMDIDLAPRIALLGILPVGFQMALQWGAPLPPVAVAVTWGLALAWIVMALVIHFGHARAPVARLLRIDLACRVALLAGFSGLAWRQWQLPGHAVPDWLILKLVVVAAIVVDGMVLRVYSGQWRLAIERLSAGDVAGGERLLGVRRRKAATAALVMWALVALAAFLGAVKPF